MVCEGHLPPDPGPPIRPWDGGRGSPRRPARACDPRLMICLKERGRARVRGKRRENEDPPLHRNEATVAALRSIYPNREAFVPYEAGPTFLASVVVYRPRAVHVCRAPSTPHPP
jgi:hypothetical protein